MRRCGLVPFVFLALGCERERPVVSRVTLPVHTPANLKPDPAPQKALTRPAVEIHGESSILRGPAATSVSTTNSVEVGVEGVCRYNESQVACWDTVGKDQPKLAKEIERTLRARGMGQPLPTIFGRKNRLVVAFFPKDTELTSTSVQASDSASHPTGGKVPPLMTDGKRNRSVVFLSADSKETNGTLLVEKRTRFREEVPISLRIGATAKLANRELKVASIGKVKPDDMDTFFMRGRPSWRIVIERSGAPKDGLSFFPVDPYPMLLTDGRRAKFSTNGKIRYAPSSVPTIRSYSYSTLPQGAVGALVDKDPSKVKTLSLGAYRVTRMQLTGFALDPR